MLYVYHCLSIFFVGNQHESTMHGPCSIAMLNYWRVNHSKQLSRNSAYYPGTWISSSLSLLTLQVRTGILLKYHISVGGATWDDHVYMFVVNIHHVCSSFRCPIFYPRFQYGRNLRDTPRSDPRHRAKSVCEQAARMSVCG
jgi:hypothetical protein